MSKFKVGDKVKLVTSTYPDGGLGGVFCEYSVGDDLVVGRLKGVNESKSVWDDDSGVYSVDDWWVSGSMLELAVNTGSKQYT